ncbi:MULTISPECIES: hypothetical protein [Serratia]|nr:MULTISPECIES: hypothetical protein [Serratia]WVJ42271.1 hypothetical protein V1234_01665 [Serratia marcescens]
MTKATNKGLQITVDPEVQLGLVANGDEHQVYRAHYGEQAH